jgi:hypothetical protein
LDIAIIQKVFDKQKLFTIWEKTDILSGYYVVHYFSKTGIFSTSEDYINRTINDVISYVNDIIIPDFVNIQKNFRKELEQFINIKKEEQQHLKTFAIISCIYPGQTKMKISFFGQADLVKRLSRQLQYLINKHRLTITRADLSVTQVCI